MGKQVGATVMFVLIGSMALAAFILFLIEYARFRAQMRAARFRRPGSDAEEDYYDDDPYDIGINDKDIL